MSLQKIKFLPIWNRFNSFLFLLFAHLLMLSLVLMLFCFCLFDFCPLSLSLTLPASHLYLSLFSFILQQASYCGREDGHWYQAQFFSSVATLAERELVSSRIKNVIILLWDSLSYLLLKYSNTKVSQKEYIKFLKPDLLTIFGVLASFYCYNVVFNKPPNLLQSQKILRCSKSAVSGSQSYVSSLIYCICLIS